MDISQDIKLGIKKVIKTILYEVELRNSREINGVIPVQISIKKFEHAEDLARLIQIINEGKRILRIIPEFEFNKSLYSDKITGESIAKLMQMRSALELPFGFGKEGVAGEYLYFLIEDIERLKEIKKDIDGKIEEADIGFNSLNGVFSLGVKFYKIRSKIRLELCRKLWQERQVIKVETGKVLRKGQSFPKESLAVQIGLISFPREFSLSIKGQLKSEISELNRIFKNKKFPLRIKTANGVQLFVKVKK